MKLLITTTFLVAFGSVFAQKSENLLPKDAVSVFSIDNVNLLQKISLDDLVKYEFMEEVQQELFDGSTSGKTLKDAGIDFEQRINFFQGSGKRFRVTGFTFGIENRDQLFEVFDDFHAIESDYSGVDFYESYFNRIAIRGNSAVLFRVQGHSDHVEHVTDSIWYARGNDYPWYEYQYDEMILESLQPEDAVFDGNETIENTNSPSENNLPQADEDPTQKTYYELRDSVELDYHLHCVKRLCDELFLRNESLMLEDERFAEQLTHSADGIFYLDLERSVGNERDMKFLYTYYPNFSVKSEELYAGSIVLGDMKILDNAIELDLDVEYGEKLGPIYNELTDTKFDKHVLKYIHKDNNAYFTQNVNLRKAYEEAYDVVMPILSNSERSIAASAIMIELMDALVDKDAVFGVYQGSMFGAYNGLQTVKTKKIIFDYDEETFEYSEIEVEAEEDMPVFVMGFTTKRGDVPEKVLNRLSKIYSKMTNMEDYWLLEDVLLGAAPMYFIIKNDLFIMTNDMDLATNHPNGYGSEAIGKREAKKARKSGALYGHVDAGKALQNLPRGIFSDYENEMIDVIRGKSGTMEVTSTKSVETSTSFKLAYQFEGEYENSGTYFLDLINSLYVVTK
tara:strand:- start:6761 stop:8623 length:1863 start_codon:yes stop_codon:yes gene_type:complete